MKYPVTLATAQLRKDAAQNWQRIVEVGRQLVDDGVPLQLNDVARLAGVGVAAVYRHFPTPEALLETVAAPALRPWPNTASAPSPTTTRGRRLRASSSPPSTRC